MGIYVSKVEGDDFYLIKKKYDDSVASKKVSPRNEIEELKYSICVVGSGGVGKSCITIRFVKNQFDDEYYDPTIEDSYYAIRIIGIGDIKKRVLLNIVDTAGQEEYMAIRNESLAKKDAYILVYDVTDEKSFMELYSFDKDIQRITDNKDYVGILVANKIDLKRKVSIKESMEFCKKRNFMYAEVSAKTGKNIDQLFEIIMKSIFLSKNMTDMINKRMTINTLNNKKNEIDKAKKEIKKSNKLI